MGVFDGQRAVWQWQYAGQGEQSAAEVAATLTQYAGAGTWLVKCMDGQDWQATYDRSANAIASLGQWKQTVAAAQAAGITAVPWVVATGPADAAAHAQLGPVLVVDLEPYPQFWTAAAGEVLGYLAALHAGGVTELYVSLDPRPSALAALDAPSWAGSVAGLLPQLYWTDFQQPAMACLPYLQACLALNANVYPVLPYNGASGDLMAFWNACAALGCRGVSLWRLGSANAAQLQAFAALTVAASPADPCVDVRQQLVAANARIEQLTTILAAVRAAVDDFV